MADNNLEKELIALLGGKENISSVTHCATRLRFQVRDRACARPREDALPAGVAAFVEFAGELQFVVEDLLPVYRRVLDELGMKAEETAVSGFSRIVSGAVRTEVVCSPCSGIMKPLSVCSDPLFASGAAGIGVSIEPQEGKLVSPVTGIVTSVYPTKHAIGITSLAGAEILVHIGINTVQLKGRYLSNYVKQGEPVIDGHPIAAFEPDKIRNEGFQTEVLVLLLNPERCQVTVPEKEKPVHTGERLFHLEPRG